MTNKLIKASKPFRDHAEIDMIGLKEWAFAQGYCIESYRVPKEKNKYKAKYYIQLTENYKNKSLVRAYGPTEHDAVVEVCEWIIMKDIGG